ncbi:MAG: hypothetical protein EOO25_10875 [Comamonadaceae bacterium]|nr:MAG: hypothetical protein EOO25_10875 [Comamonadaceae bacterium]
MFPNRTRARLLQQQPARHSDQQQQQAGSNEFQPKPAASGAPQREQQMGEGSYEATRDYQKNIGDYLKKADVQKDAEAAKPRSEAEAEELKKAEEEGRSHAKD